MGTPQGREVPHSIPLLRTTNQEVRAATRLW